MRLENSLDLKEGTKVMATVTSLGPYALTRGKVYTLIGDAVPVGGTKPYNSDFPIIDDRGKKVQACYINFNLAPQEQKAKQS